MRSPLGPLFAALALVLAGCSTDPAPAAAPAAPSPMTATSALGDFTTLDYCSLLDVSRLRGATADDPDSSFTDCRADFVRGGRSHTVAVGPLAADADPNVKPYEYSGPLPDGVSVQQAGFTPDKTCSRAVTFADGIRLAVSVSDGEGLSANGDRCGDADAVVGGVLAAVSGGRVKHHEFPDRSWGRVDPCALLDVHDLDAISGANTQPSAGLSGHSCIRGTVSIDFAVQKQVPTGATETLGGRTARQATDGAFCRLTTTQPSPSTPGRGEQAVVSVVDTTGSSGAAACPAAQQVAALVFAKIP
ncbi:hypothetical protein [Amycolatopsis sp. NPDC051903]|uniref:hypothetical protein n=1 Tax=Amycolatopsis sp. NPDC051903 TaxID=3363936 RepID=UPI0037BAB0D9